MSDDKLLKEIEKLKKRISGLEKTNQALMNRVERSVDSSGNSFSMLESNILLHKKVTERTKELEQNNKEMRHLAQQARQASLAKSEFLANMSHEIRTPMNAILGYIDLMRDRIHDKEALSYLDIISDSGNFLVDIINDILDYSKVEAGKMELSPVIINLRDELNLIDRLFSESCRKKDIEFTMNISETVPLIVKIDYFRLRQVLINLLSNAAKFTEMGKKVTLSVDYRKEELLCGVEDEGVGISSDVIETIFEAFSQAESSTTRKYGGTGLGLSISQRLVSLLGGELKVISRVGKGSRFFFTVPAPAEEFELEQNTVEEEQSYCADFNILIVEDNLVNQKLISAYLKKLGYRFEIVANGKLVIEAYKSGGIDLILMDENMPEMNGILATKEIRKLEVESKLEHIPIIALTANAMTGDRERFLASGMDEYLAKPVGRKDLAAMLAKFLQRADSSESA